MRRPAIVLASLALVIAGCGGSDSDSGSSSGGSSSGSSGGTAKTPAAGAKGKASVQVTMKNIKFNPMNITVKRGQIVRWTNDDSVTHNVTKEKGPGAELQSPNVNPGKTFQAKFDTPGRIDYVCTIHPNQTGVITVK